MMKFPDDSSYPGPFSEDEWRLGLSPDDWAKWRDPEAWERCRRSILYPPSKLSGRLLVEWFHIEAREKRARQHDEASCRLRQKLNDDMKGGIIALGSCPKSPAEEPKAVSRSNLSKVMSQISFQNWASGKVHFGNEEEEFEIRVYRRIDLVGGSADEGRGADQGRPSLTRAETRGRKKGQAPLDREILRAMVLEVVSALPKGLDSTAAELRVAVMAKDPRYAAWERSTIIKAINEDRPAIQGMLRERSAEIVAKKEPAG